MLIPCFIMGTLSGCGGKTAGSSPESNKNTLACYDFQSEEFIYLTEKDLDWHLPYFTAPFQNIERVLGGDEPLEGKEYDWPYHDYE